MVGRNTRPPVGVYNSSIGIGGLRREVAAVYHGYGGKAKVSCETVELTDDIITFLFETPHDASPKYALMITAYLDESEHSDVGKYTVVAGFRGKKENWDLFVPLWKQGLGNRKSLHMRSLRWNHPNAKSRVGDLLARLGPIPYDCGLIPVYGAVKAGDYLDLVRGDPILEDFGGYLLSISHVFTLLLETIPPHERIKIVCEAQEGYASNADAVFKVFKIASRDGLYPKLVSIDFVPKGSTSLTEPADYLAFSLSKTLSEPGSQKDLWARPIQGEGRQLQCAPGMWLNREVARETIQQIKQQRRLR
jgi:hypothetical protein